MKRGIAVAGYKPAGVVACTVLAAEGLEQVAHSAVGGLEHQSMVADTAAAAVGRLCVHTSPSELVEHCQGQAEVQAAKLQPEAG